MPIEIKVPEMGESITEGSIADWHVQPGEAFDSGAVIVEIETDKVTQEIYAPSAGALTDVKFNAGDTVKIGDVIAIMEEGAGGAPAAAPAAAAPAAATPAAAPAPAGPTNDTLPPGARRMVAEHGLNPADIQGTGLRGQVTKPDVVNHLDKAPPAAAPAPAAPPAAKRAASTMSPEEREKLVPMSRLRQRIAERLVEAQHTAAILTTFNEVDMSALMALRKKYKEQFKEKHGVGLGFMSFFARASIEALRLVPEINAEIRGTDVLYKNYFDIGVAVGGPKGLVVPIVRDAQDLSFAGIEQEIMRLAIKVRDGQIGLEDLQGGTFTISNGGVYGSMMSTPIINPPQSGILGMHNIVKRAVVVNDEIVIRPMMYIALSYDHRIVDGKGAVSFLVRVKECIENPERMLLDI